MDELKQPEVYLIDKIYPDEQIGGKEERACVRINDFLRLRNRLLDAEKSIAYLREYLEHKGYRPDDEYSMKYPKKEG